MARGPQAGSVLRIGGEVPLPGNATARGEGANPGATRSDQVYRMLFPESGMGSQAMDTSNTTAGGPLMRRPLGREMGSIGPFLR